MEEKQDLLCMKPEAGLWKILPFVTRVKFVFHRRLVKEEVLSCQKHTQ